MDRIHLHALPAYGSAYGAVLQQCNGLGQLWALIGRCRGDNTCVGELCDFGDQPCVGHAGKCAVEHNDLLLLVFAWAMHTCDGCHNHGTKAVTSTIHCLSQCGGSLVVWLA